MEKEQVGGKIYTRVLTFKLESPECLIFIISGNSRNIYLAFVITYCVETDLLQLESLTFKTKNFIG